METEVFVKSGGYSDAEVNMRFMANEKFRVNGMFQVNEMFVRGGVWRCSMVFMHSL